MPEFHYQYIREFIDDNTRQEIRLSEDQTAAGGINSLLAVIPASRTLCSKNASSITVSFLRASRRIVILELVLI